MQLPVQSPYQKNHYRGLFVVSACQIKGAGAARVDLSLKMLAGLAVGFGPREQPYTLQGSLTFAT